jgi:hypothetical protein
MHLIIDKNIVEVFRWVCTNRFKTISVRKGVFCVFKLKVGIIVKLIYKISLNLECEGIAHDLCLKKNTFTAWIGILLIKF